MEIEQAIFARQEMEEKIRIAIDHALGEFRKQTGLCPYEITIGFVEVTSLGSVRGKLMVSQVSVNVQL